MNYLFICQYIQNYCKILYNIKLLNIYYIQKCALKMLTINRKLIKVLTNHINKLYFFKRTRVIKHTNT